MTELNRTTLEERKRRREWAEAHVGPMAEDCKHEVLVILNGILTCTECKGRRVVA